MIKCRRLEENGDKRIKKSLVGDEKWDKRMMIVIKLDQGEESKMLSKKEMKGIVFFTGIGGWDIRSVKGRCWKKK